MMSNQKISNIMSIANEVVAKQVKCSFIKNKQVVIFSNNGRPECQNSEDSCITFPCAYHKASIERFSRR